MKKIRIKSGNIHTDIIFVIFTLVITLVILRIESCSVFYRLGIKKIFLNVLIEMIEWGIFFLLSGRLRFSCLGVLTLNVFIGFINAQVKIFRGSEITINDIRSVGTALNVADKYRVVLNARLMIAIFLYVIVTFILAITVFYYDKYGKMRIWVSLIFIMVAIAILYYASSNYTPFFWGDEGALNNGILLEWVIELRKSRVDPPEGYSMERVEEIIDRYRDTHLQEDRNSNAPNIIVIMSESYADLDVLGNIKTNKDYSVFFDKVYNSSVHGYALSSVFGGKTANSEWEFLTESTMYFLPQGAVPYQQYVDKGSNSLVKILKDQGYETFSVHPCTASNWARDKVYLNLGFDECFWESDFKNAGYVRNLISDESFYNEIINIFENKGEDSLFIFGISIQNHGNYEQMTVNQRKIYLENMQNEYHDVDEYLSLLSISDEALENFISYFESSEEEVMILFFGDHQPSLNEAFYTELGSDLSSKFIIPFFIWDNYSGKGSEDLGLTSINYLSDIMLSEAGLKVPLYDQILLKVREQIPAICALGYMDINGQWNSVYDSEAENPALNDLWILQYAKDMDDRFHDHRLFLVK